MNFFFTFSKLREWVKTSGSSDIFLPHSFKLGEKLAYSVLDSGGGEWVRVDSVRFKLNTQVASAHREESLFDSTMFNKLGTLLLCSCGKSKSFNSIETHQRLEPGTVFIKTIGTIRSSHDDIEWQMLAAFDVSTNPVSAVIAGLKKINGGSDYESSMDGSPDIPKSTYGNLYVKRFVTHKEQQSLMRFIARKSQLHTILRKSGILVIRNGEFGRS